MHSAFRTVAGAVLALALAPCVAAQSGAPDAAPAPAAAPAPSTDAPSAGGGAVDPAAARLRNSVIKLACKLEPRSAVRPWKLDPIEEVGGSGVVIAPGRVLTNAHVVHQSSEVLLETERTALPVPGKVLAVDLGRDLALVQVDDADFNAEHPPVELLDGLPRDGSRVTVMGFPMGGESLSTTSGVVSRCEWAEVGLNDEEGMRIQVDAAVNFGNSGGPAFVDGRIAGLAFSGADSSVADNISYLIATEEIRRFLREAEAGALRGNCELHASVQTLENPALRAKLGVGSKTSGVVVIDQKGGPLQAWDIITKANGMAIDNKGQVTLEDGRKVSMSCALGRFDPAKDGKTIPLEVVRDGKPIAVDLPAVGSREGIVRSRPNGDYPYLVCGPLAFGPMHKDLLSELASMGSAGLFYMGGGPVIPALADSRPSDGREIVAVLGPMMSSPVGRGYDVIPGQTVKSVNGKEFRNFAEFVDVMRDVDGEWLVFEFNERGIERLVFRRQEFMDATEPVMESNGIRQQASKDIRDRWNARSK
jgi:S1-C subfamily serine protease